MYLLVSAAVSAILGLQASDVKPFQTCPCPTWPRNKGQVWCCCCSFVKSAAKLLVPCLEEQGLAGHDWCIKQCQEAGWEAAVHELVLIKSANLLRQHEHQSAMGLLQVASPLPAILAVWSRGPCSSTLSSGVDLACQFAGQA